MNASQPVTGAVQLQYTYATSATPNIQQTDDQTAYLVPALNVVFSLSLDVSFDRALCKAVGRQFTTWSVGVILYCKIATVSLKLSARYLFSILL